LSRACWWRSRCDASGGLARLGEKALARDLVSAGNFIVDAWLAAMATHAFFAPMRVASFTPGALTTDYFLEMRKWELAASYRTHPVRRKGP
jgi:hypothetical protein